MHLNCLLLYRKYVLPRIPPGARCLEVGAKGGVFIEESKALDATARWSRTGLKRWRNNDVWMTDDEHIECEDGRFDVVFSANTLEHVRRPWRWVPELARVTKPGGIVALIAPITWIYHKSPVDCWRIWPEGARGLFREAGLAAELVRAESLDETDDPEILKRQFGGCRPIDLVAIGRKGKG